MTICEYRSGPLSAQIQMGIILFSFVERPFEGQGLGFPSGILVFISSVRGGEGLPQAAAAALALQFLLRPPGAARRALRAGVGRGAEHLFKAASPVVRPAYFRLMSPNFLLMAVPTLLKAAVAFCPA